MSTYLSWNKKIQDWNLINLKKYKKKFKDFWECPHCNSNNLDFTLYYREDLKKFKSKDWICHECTRKINLNALSEETKNFINNLVLKELDLIYNNPVKIIVKNKKGKEVDLKVLGPQIGIKSGTESIDYICGICKNKNQFNVQDESKNIFQCLNCDFYNTI